MATATYTLKSNGLSVINGTDIVSGQWWSRSPTPFERIGEVYEVKATLANTPTANLTGTFDTWVSLKQDQTWSAESAGQTQTLIDIQIREIYTKEIVGQAQLNLSNTAQDNINGFRIKITIVGSNIDNTLIDYPFRITEANMPTEFFQNVTKYGDELTAISVNGDLLDIEVVELDKKLQKLEVYVKIPSITNSGVDFFLHYGPDCPKVTFRNNIWDGKFSTVLHYRNSSIPTDSSNLSNSVSPINIDTYSIPSKFFDEPRSADTQSHQGVTTDNINFWTSDTNAIYKRDLSFNLISSNLDPNSNTMANTNHLGDLDVYNGMLYIPIQNWTDCNNNFAHIIARYNADDLSYIDEVSVDADNIEIASIYVDIEFNEILIVSYCDNNFIYRYDLVSRTILGTIPLTSPIQFMQGITRYGDYYYITSDSTNDDSIYKVRVDGVVIGKIWRTTSNEGVQTLDNIEGITSSTSKIYVLVDRGITEQRITPLVEKNGAYFNNKCALNVTMSNPPQNTGYSFIAYKRSTVDQDTLVSFSQNTSVNNRATLAIDNGNDLGFWDSNNGWLRTGVNPKLNQDTTAAFSFSNNGKSIYVEGQLSISDNNILNNNLRDRLFVGVEDLSFNELYTGEIQETRFMNVIPSLGWMKLDDLSYRDNKSTYLVGQEEISSCVCFGFFPAPLSIDFPVSTGFGTQFTTVSTFVCDGDSIAVQFDQAAIDTNTALFLMSLPTGNSVNLYIYEKTVGLPNLLLDYGVQNAPFNFSFDATGLTGKEIFLVAENLIGSDQTIDLLDDQP